MQTAQIKCIKKPPRDESYHRITHIGGYTDRQWKITTDAAIGIIERREWEYFTLVGGHRRKVIIAVRLGRKYLKTEADRDTPDNLLSLPECP